MEPPGESILSLILKDAPKENDKNAMNAVAHQSVVQNDQIAELSSMVKTLLEEQKQLKDSI